MDKQKNYKLIVHILITVICISVFYYVTVRTKPNPFSDFLYYWDYVIDLSQYYKGGLLFLLYAPLKLLGLQPYISAFIVNSLCFVALAYTMWIGKKSKLQLLSSILLALVGIWFLGFIPLVNTDIPTITLYLFGIRLFINFLDSKKFLSFISAILFTAIALSLRSQLFYISLLLILMVTIILVYQYIKGRKLNKTLKLFLVLLIGSTFISFTTTKYLEIQTSNTTALTIHKRLTFYTGLFNTSSNNEWCGSWSLEAEEQAKEEINIPFAQILLKNIEIMSLEQISEIVRCKWSNYIFEYNQSGMTWLQGHLTKGWTEAKSFGIYWEYFVYLERFVGRILKLTAFSLVLLFIYDIKKFNKTEIVVFSFTFFIVFMFFAIHTVLEIQPRYLISPIMIALVIPLYLLSGKFKEL